MLLKGLRFRVLRGLGSKGLGFKGLVIRSGMFIGFSKSSMAKGFRTLGS